MPQESELVESEATMDRRRATRHEVERPCRVESESQPTEAMPGLTANMSRSGILIRLAEASRDGRLPKIGEQACVKIDLPPSRKYAPRALECQGRIVRVDEKGEEAPSVALQVDRMQFRDLPHKGRRKPKTPKQ